MFAPESPAQPAKLSTCLCDTADTSISRRTALALTATFATWPAKSGDFRRQRRSVPFQSSIEQYLAAGVSALAIGSKSPITRFPGASWVNWTDEPTSFVAGPLGIDACYVAETPMEMLLVFRPTESPKTLDIPAVLDWINDFNAYPIPVKNLPGKVHQGFWQSVDNLSTTGFVSEIRRRQALRAKPIAVVGYSKGGGMAPLAAMWLSGQGIQVNTVTLFEAPRCGDTNFTMAYERKFPKTMRYEFQDDLIVHLPPTQATLNIVAKIPILGPLLEKIFHKYTQWDYQAVGRLQFADWDLKIREASPELSHQRTLHLLEVVLGPHHKNVFRDHLPCGLCSALAPLRKCPWSYMQMQ